MNSKITLSEYCTLFKPFVEQYISDIDRKGFTLAWNNRYKYTTKPDFLDGCVEIIVNITVEGKVEKDISYAEAFRISGLVDSYLQSTSIIGSVIGKGFGSIWN